jgi:DNA-directed RNA polymerase specialized sigma24 family protein
MALESLDQVAQYKRESLRRRVDQVLGEVSRRIPECSYRVLYTHWVEGRTMPEIAALVNLSIEQVWTHHRRAREEFRCLFHLRSDKEAPTS